MCTVLGSQPTMVLLFESLFQHFNPCFPGLSFVRTAIHFQDTTHLDLKLTTILTISKSLSYLRICVLREPKGSRTILIHFKTTTYLVNQLGRLPPCQNIATSYRDVFLPFVQFMTIWHNEVITNNLLVKDSQCHLNDFESTSHFMTNQVTNTK